MSLSLCEVVGYIIFLYTHYCMTVELTMCMAYCTGLLYQILFKTMIAAKVYLYKLSVLS